MKLNGLTWWIDRWRKSTAYTDMTLEEQGAYRNLLDEAWLRGGPLPFNDRTLAKASGDARRWPKVRATVLGGSRKRNTAGDMTRSIMCSTKQRNMQHGLLHIALKKRDPDPDPDL